MAGVPPLKPRPYYEAVDLIERIRTFVARRSATPDERPGVRILGYHRVSADRDVLAVTPERFRQQLEAVRGSGAEIVRLDQAHEALDRGTDRPLVCITFDDGYLDNLTVALPILKEFDAPATLYLPTNLLSGAPDFYWYRGARPPALTPEQIGELARDGWIDIQSHSITHPLLPSLSDAAAEKEVRGSRELLVDAMGVSVTSFSYPAGLYGPRDVALVRAAGYRTAVTNRAGLNLPGQAPHEFNRTMVSWADDLARFQAKIAGLLDTPSPLTTLAQRVRGQRRA